MVKFIKKINSTNMDFHSIPDEFKIKQQINQKKYLVGGALKDWNGPTSEVFSTISSTPDYAPTLLGSIPLLEKEQAMEALEAATNAYNKGQGL